MALKRGLRTHRYTHARHGAVPDLSLEKHHIVPLGQTMPIEMMQCFEVEIMRCLVTTRLNPLLSESDPALSAALSSPIMVRRSQSCSTSRLRSKVSGGTASSTRATWSLWSACSYPERATSRAA